MEDKKKMIYVLTNSNFESGKVGFVHTENKSLVKAGFRVKSITYHRPGTPKQEVVDGVLIKTFKYLPGRFAIKLSIQQEINKSKFGIIKALFMVAGFFIYTFFESIKEKPDLFLAHWAFPTGYIAYKMSRIFKKKCVIQIHGSEVTQTKNSKLLQKLLIPAMNNSTLIIANSDYTKNEFVKLGVKEEKFVKIGNPPNYVKHTADSEFLKTFRKKFADDSSKILLFVGNLIELKGAEYAIRSLSFIKDHKVHLIIAGAGMLESKLKELTKSLGLGSIVTFFGLARSQDMGWLYDISDVFVCPPIIDSKGFTENLCKTIPEAMESGLPVVATNVGGLSEVVQNEKTGLLVEQKDSQAIAKAVDRILSDNILRNTLVSNSKSIVDEFSLESLEQKYVNSIKKILK